MLFVIGKRIEEKEKGYSPNAIRFHYHAESAQKVENRVGSSKANT